MFEKIILIALEEDLGDIGDITTNCVAGNEKVKFSVNAREDMLLSGVKIAQEIFTMYRNEVDVSFIREDGDEIRSGSTILEGTGSSPVILSIERVLINFLQRASGISSRTRELVNAVAGTKTKIRSTRKTAPGLRIVDIYAVTVGGGEAYRTGLYDGIMLKDNHIASYGGITKCVSKIRDKLGERVVILVECDNIEQVAESIDMEVNTILLDNMSFFDMRKSIEMVKSSGKQFKIEASGGINMENVSKIATLGVDYISTGSITNSFSCKDIGLDIV